MADHSNGNFYAGSGLDRATHLRGDRAWLLERLGAESSRFVPVWRSRNLVAADDHGHELPEPVFLDATAASKLIEPDAPIVLLGLDSDVAYFAIDLSHIEAPETGPAVVPGTLFTELRGVGAMMGRNQGALLAYARGMLTWHRRHRYCGSCGSATDSVEGGFQRICRNPECKEHHFPRTDPAVIMLVTDGERCLLGRQARWPAGMYSTLAGFVEPGETLEEAVAREVKEESGISVRRVRYHSSQPWPFPTSLMLGFYADAASLDVELNSDELEDARWFERSWLIENNGKNGFFLPRADSIARRLINDWLAETT
jgi:NAD+ diphosphatase